MSRLNLDESSILPITFKGQDIDLQKPSMKMIFEMEGKVKEHQEDSGKIYEVMKGFIVSLGMPAELAEDMGLGHFEKIMDGLKGSKKN